MAKKTREELLADFDEAATYRPNIKAALDFYLAIEFHDAHDMRKKQANIEAYMQYYGFGSSGHITLKDIASEIGNFTEARAGQIISRVSKMIETRQFNLDRDKKKAYENAVKALKKAKVPLPHLDDI